MFACVIKTCKQNKSSPGIAGRKRAIVAVTLSRQNKMMCVKVCRLFSSSQFTCLQSYNNLLTDGVLNVYSLKNISKVTVFHFM